MERDLGPSAEGAASFHTTRWTIVMRAAQSQAPGRPGCCSNPNPTCAVRMSAVNVWRAQRIDVDHLDFAVAPRSPMLSAIPRDLRNNFSRFLLVPFLRLLESRRMY